jgi:hypothetical protein
VLAAQRLDAEVLATDAQARGPIAEADRHHQLIARLDAHIQAWRRPDEPGLSPPRRTCLPRHRHPPTNQLVTFDNVAARTRLGRATFCRNPELRAVIEEHHHRDRKAHTITGLATQIDQLRTTVKPSPRKSAATKKNYAPGDAAIPAEAPDPTPTPRSINR